MVGQNHQLNGYEFEQTLGDSEDQVSLACKSRTRLRDWTATTTREVVRKLLGSS